MIANKTLNTFFEENFKNSALPYLLYKDKQLLKEKNYKAFAEEQIKKTRNIFASVVFAFFYGAYYSATSFVEYGGSGETLSLVLGVLVLVFMATAIFYSTKEYYSIKSSMEFFLNLLEENEKTEASSLTT